MMIFFWDGMIRFWRWTGSRCGYRKF